MKPTLAFFLCLAFASVSGQDVPAVKVRSVPVQRSEYRVKIAFECDQHKDHLLNCDPDGCWCWHETPASDEWTCFDPSAALMTSVSGKEHWCHKPQIATKDVRIDTTYHGPAGQVYGNCVGCLPVEWKPADHFRDSTKGIGKDGKQAKPLEGLDGKAYILEGGTLPKGCWVSLPEFGAFYFSSTACGKVPVELAKLPDSLASPKEEMAPKGESK